MNSHKSLLVAAFVVQLIPIGLAIGRQEVSDAENKIQTVIEASTVFDASKGYESLLRTTDLSILKNSKHPMIATQAAWQQVMRSIRETTGKTDESPTYAPTRQKLDEFLVFVADKSQLELPVWWKNFILKTNGVKYIRPIENAGIYAAVYPCHEDGEEDFYNKYDPEKPIWAPPDTTVIDNDGKVVVSKGDDSIRVPDELVLRYSEGTLYGTFCVHFTTKKCFLAIQENDWFPFDIVCIDRMTEEIDWKTEAWGTSQAGYRVYRSTNTLAEQDGRLVLFGASYHGANIETFDLKTGDPQFRFFTQFTD